MVSIDKKKKEKKTYENTKPISGDGTLTANGDGPGRPRARGGFCEPRGGAFGCAFDRVVEYVVMGFITSLFVGGSS